MKRLSIQRQGSFLYASGYRKLVFWAEVVYIGLGAALGVLAAILLESIAAGAAVFGVALIVVACVWLVYQSILWVFKREAGQSVEISDAGIMETRGGREHRFIPWDGVMEIEVDATVVAGGSLRVKGKFSRITLSNMDLVITEPARIREMHAALEQGRPMREMLAELRLRAPHARIRMNRLARRILSPEVSEKVNRIE